MKFTLSWLKQHLETDAELERITDMLTMIGLELEQLTDPAKELAPFTVGRVISAELHPNADKLRVCLVETSQGEVQVVCGAPNARAGMKGVFAAAGTRIPGTGLDLRSTKIRGVESHGMLCSEREMGISEEHTGIIELPEDAEVGAPFAVLAGLDDPVIEVGVTPNRQDCLGVRGIARDLAAAGIGRLLPLDETTVAGRFASPIDVKLDFEPDAADACPMFVGRYVRGVANGPSPDWLRRKLSAIGLRPISTLVDITNYVTYDLGRPLHVFDADKVTGDLRVHLGRAGDRLVALDGKEYEIDPAVCAISDDTGVLSLGGLMGGAASGCTEATRNVFVEAALFDPLRTAASGRRLAILSDARFRFERGVDPDFVVAGMEIATALVMRLCGGEPSELVVAGAPPPWRRSVPLRADRVRTLVGVDVPRETTVEILAALGFEPTAADGGFDVAVPPWRSDIAGESDLVEEIARIHGFDKIPSLALPRATTVAKPTLTAGQKRVRAARRALAARGMVEAVTYSFLPRRQAELFGGGSADLTLANPISAELDQMRPSILPNLIAAAGRNMDRGTDDLAMFEVGPQYADDTPQGQASVAAAIRRGRIDGRHWATTARPVDAFDVKADARAALAAAGAPVRGLQVTAGAPAWYHPGRSGAIRLGPNNVLAWFGELHPAVLDEMDVAGPLVGCEILLDNIPAPKAKAASTRPPLDVSNKQAVERDFAFVVAPEVAADQVVRAARGADKDLITEVAVFDVYQGERIGADRKSIAIAVRLDPRERTLTDADIEAVSRKIVERVGKATGGTLRG